MAVRALRFQFPGIDNVRCLFQMRGPKASTPEGGDGTRDLSGTFVFRDDVDSALVTANRRALLDLAGVHAFGEVHQVHGDRVVFEPDPARVDAPATEDADGLATSRVGFALAIKTADCQPVLLAHKSGKYVAGLHVGWRGNRQLFPYTGVRAFCRHYGVRPEDCCAVRGPSLGPTAARFTHFAAEWGAYFEKYLDLTHQTMDLWTMTADQLHMAGIPYRQIHSLDLCTVTNNEDFFSYRADRECGRQAALIWRTA